MALDASTLERLGAVPPASPALFGALPLLNIDHHLTNPRFGTVNLVDAQAAATAELVTLLAQRMCRAPLRPGRDLPPGRADDGHPLLPDREHHPPHPARRRQPAGSGRPPPRPGVPLLPPAHAPAAPWCGAGPWGRCASGPGDGWPGSRSAGRCWRPRVRRRIRGASPASPRASKGSRWASRWRRPRTGRSSSGCARRPSTWRPSPPASGAGGTPAPPGCQFVPPATLATAGAALLAVIEGALPSLPAPDSPGPPPA